MYTLSTLLSLIALGIPIAFALLGVALLVGLVQLDLPVATFIPQLMWNSVTASELVVLPMFLLMAEILIKGEMTSRLFRGLSPLAERLPGGLVHINVLASTILAAICGSSAATTGTVGRLSLPELRRRNYPESLAIGSLAGAGTIGFLIPPSIIMIVYAVLAETSLLKLFAAGVVPGLLLSGLYMAYIGGVSRDGAGGGAQAEPAAEETAATWRPLADLAPTAGLILLVIGSMYGGLASPSESAAFGVLGALLIVLASGKMSTELLLGAATDAARTTSMIGLIIAAASCVSVMVAYLGLPQDAARAIAALELGPLGLLTLLLSFYLLLGCFLDGLSTVVLTLPICLPLVVDAGYSGIWFGVFVVIVCEVAQITPPLGLNLFVIQKVAGNDIYQTARYAFPFLLILLGMCFVLILVPSIATTLPALLFGP